MDVTSVAITGGPCGGKTTLLARAKEYLDGRGYKTIIVPEIATELISAGFSPKPGQWREPLAFQEHLLGQVLSREHVYHAMARDLATAAPVVLLHDRGVPDIEAYVGRQAYVALLSKRTLRRLHMLLRYEMAIHMVTAADGALAHYTLANNAARTETPDEAKVLDKRTQAAWFGHPSLAVIRNEASFEMKVQAALRALSRRLGIRRLLFPVERERMFLIRNFSYDFIPGDAVKRDIWQTYLVEHLPDQERRVRKVLCHNDVAYYYTQKIGSKTYGERDETQEVVTPRRYQELMAGRDGALQEVIKTRYSFTFANRYMELDDFRHPVANLRTVEIENVDPKEVIEFPPQWDVVEVTADKRYSNRAIAGGSLRGLAA